MYSSSPLFRRAANLGQRVITLVAGVLLVGTVGPVTLAADRPTPSPNATQQVASATTATTTPGVAAQEGQAFAQDPGVTPVAIVNGHVITERDLYEALLDVAGRNVLDQLILVQLIDDAAQKAGVSMSPAEVDQQYDQIRSQFATADQFDQALQQAGLTPSLLRQQIRINGLLTQLVSPLVTVTEKDIQSYYDQNKAQLGEPAQVRARHILVSTQAEAEELVKELRAGADFAKLAQAHSIDTGSAKQGGELGFFTQDQMVPEFAQAAFSLPVGQISDPVKTQYGYHIIQVEEKKEAQIPSLDQVRSRIQDTLRSQRLDQMVPLWIQQLEATASIQRFWPPAEATSATAEPAPGSSSPAAQGATSTTPPAESKQP